MNIEKDTLNIKNKVLKMGANLVGICDPHAITGSPDGHIAPDVILPGVKSVIVMLMRLPMGSVQTPTFPVDGDRDPMEVVRGGVYLASYMQANMKLNEYCNDLARDLEDMGYRSCPISSTMGKDEERWLGVISLRWAAAQAGLGDIGPSRNFLCPEYGSRVRIGAVLTTMPLTADGSKLLGKVCTVGQEASRKMFMDTDGGEYIKGISGIGAK